MASSAIAKSIATESTASDADDETGWKATLHEFGKAYNSLEERINSLETIGYHDVKLRLTVLDQRLQKQAYENTKNAALQARVDHLEAALASSKQVQDALAKKVDALEAHNSAANLTENVRYAIFPRALPRSPDLENVTNQGSTSMRDDTLAMTTSQLAQILIKRLENDNVLGSVAASRLQNLTAWANGTSSGTHSMRAPAAPPAQSEPVHNSPDRAPSPRQPASAGKTPRKRHVDDEVEQVPSKRRMLRNRPDYPAEMANTTINESTDRAYTEAYGNGDAPSVETSPRNKINKATVQRSTPRKPKAAAPASIVPGTGQPESTKLPDEQSPTEPRRTPRKVAAAHASVTTNAAQLRSPRKHKEQAQTKASRTPRKGTAAHANATIDATPPRSTKKDKTKDGQTEPRRTPRQSKPTARGSDFVTWLEVKARNKQKT